jgi:hypothetical protein
MSIFAVGLGVMASLSCTNVFTPMADTGTDPALLYEAKLLIDQHDFTGAISSITSMTSTGQASTAARDVLASAYAGRCGLDAITLAQNLGTSSNNSLFAVLFSGFLGSTAQSVSDCRTARGILAAMTSPSIDEDILLTLVAFSTIGATLNHDFDTNHDNVIDSPINQCAASPLSDSDAVDVFVNIAYAITALTNAGSTIAGSSLGAINTLCAALPDPTVCNRTDPASYTANDILVLRGVITANQYIGLANCNTAPYTVVSCTCP